MTLSAVAGLRAGSSRLLPRIVLGAAIATVLARAVPTMQSWVNAQAVRRQRLEAEWKAVNEPVESRELRKRRDELGRATVQMVVQGLASGATPPEAATGLLRHVETLAQHARVEVRSIDVSPDSAFQDGVAKVTIALAAESDVFGLIAFLSAIEADSKLMAVERLHVVQPMLADGTQQDVRLRFDVELRVLVVPTSRTVP